MEEDLKVMKELAVLFIERELGVLSDSSYWGSLREHLPSKLELWRKLVKEGGRVVYVPE